jgi:hypothetical protein
VSKAKVRMRGKGRTCEESVRGKRARKACEESAREEEKGEEEMEEEKKERNSDILLRHWHVAA